MDSGLHPHHAACTTISFQPRDGCRVGCEELSGIGVIPVKNDYSIIAEVDRRQVRGHKLRISVTVRSDGILKNGKAPRIVRIEYGEVIRSGLADSKRVLNGVGS